jgi:hypothetical protein
VVQRPDLSCPFCDANDLEQVGRWGGQMITAQWRCRACGSYFEAIRDAFDEPQERDPLTATQAHPAAESSPAPASIDPK